MLKPPKLGGVEHLRLFVNQLSFDRCCTVLDVHPATLRRWLREAAPVPQAALQALYWLTDYGFSDACSEAHWSHQSTLAKVRVLESMVPGLVDLRRMDAANRSRLSVGIRLA